MKRTAMLGFVLVLTACVQWFTGGFPVSFFAFPLNVLLTAAWVLWLGVAYRRPDRPAWVRYLLSPHATAASLTLFALCCLVTGLFAQLPEGQPARGAAARLGLHSFTTSWPFVFCFLFLFTHLTLVLFRGWQTKRRCKWRFRLVHLGLWTALFCGFIGSSDALTTYAMVSRDKAERRTFSAERQIHYAPYTLRLKDFRVESYPDGMPRQYRAQVEIDGKSTEIAVNHPCSPRFGEHIYLSSYDMQKGEDTGYIMVQIVRQPWQYGTLAGIVMLLAGTLLLFVQGAERREI